MLNRKKVAFCIPNMSVGGVETVFTATISELLKKSDLEIVIVTLAKIREPVYIQWFHKHPDVKVYVYRPLSNWFEDIAPHCRGMLKPLRKIAFSIYKKYRRVFMWVTRRLADIDVFIDYKNLEFARELSYFNKPKIAWLHSSMEYFQRTGAFNKLSQYDKIVGLTDDFVDEFKDKYPQYADRIQRIFNPLDADAIKSRAKQAKVPSGQYFSHVSRLAAGKDIRTLLNAFEILYTQHPDIKLYIVGDGSMANDFKSYATTLNCHKNVIFMGAMSNPYGIMRGAIANILSSEYEGLPTVCLESQALGALMIASNCKNGPREILQDGDSGLLFSVGNAHELASQMEFAVTNKKECNAIIKKATSTLYRFNTSVICDQISFLIKELTGQDISSNKSIVFFMPPMTIGGVETALTQTLHALVKRSDIEVSVYFHVPLQEPFWVKWFANNKAIKQYVCFPKSPYFEKLKTRIPVIENLRKILFGLYKRYRRVLISKHVKKFDIVIDYVTGSSYKILKNIQGTKITWVHSSYNYLINKNLQNRVLKYDRIVCITEDCKKKLISLYPNVSNKVVKIYNPCDYEEIKRKAINGSGLDYKYFLCVSRLDYDKDIVTVINGFDLFWHNCNRPNCKLLIIGDGGMINYFKKRANELESCKEIIFLGKIPEPYGYMHDALAHILSSKSEGLPTVMIEAMAAGTLSIASDCPDGPHEISMDGAAGVLFEPGNEKMLAKILCDVFNKNINISKIKNTARKSLTRFNADTIASQIISMINGKENS